MSYPLKQSTTSTGPLFKCPFVLIGLRPDWDVYPAFGMMMLSRRSDARGAGLGDHRRSTSRPQCFRPQLFADVPLAAGQLATFVNAHPIRSHRSLSDVQVVFVDFVVEFQVEQVVRLLLHLLKSFDFKNHCLFRDPNRPPLLGMLFGAKISSKQRENKLCNKTVFNEPSANYLRCYPPKSNRGVLPRSARWLSHASGPRSGIGIKSTGTFSRRL